MMTKIVSILGALALLFLSAFIFAYDTTVFIIELIMYSLAFLLVAGSIIITIFVVINITERIKSLRAERKIKEAEQAIKERDSEFASITTPDGQVYIRETNHGVNWIARHLAQTVYTNGRYQQPSREESNAWLYYNKPSQKIIEGKYQLDAGEDKQITYHDLLNDYPHLMLLGGTGTGKTTQITQAIDYRMKQYPGAALVWLSTHSVLDNALIPSKAIVFNKPVDIAKCLDDLFVTYQGRREGGNYKHIILALDEWPEIIDELKDLEIKGGDILRRLSRGGRKTGFSLILASHGGTVGDLDTKGHSSVKQDFAQVYLDAKLTKQGKAIWQQFDKKSSRVEILLPGLVKPELSERQKEMLKLHEQGFDVKEIAAMVYSGKGGEQQRRVKQVIDDHCVD